MSEQFRVCENVWKFFKEMYLEYIQKNYLFGELMSGQCINSVRICCLCTDLFIYVLCIYHSGFNSICVCLHVVTFHITFALKIYH